MKTIFATLLILVMMSWASLSQARTTYVNGEGRASSYCNDNNCIYGIRNASERDGQQQAEFQCQLNRGRPLSYTNFCSTNCSPNMIPPGQSMMVQCSSSCRMQCEVDN